MTIGQKLTALRKARGMTQEELSEAIGVTRQTISKWELDTSTPDLDYLCKLCDLFGVTADYLIRPEREEVETTTPPAAPSPVPPFAESPTPPTSQKPQKPPLNIRPAGWVMLGLAGILLFVSLISFVTDNSMPELMIFAGVALVFAVELLFIRWKPLFVVMWTVWAIWTGSQAVITGRMIFSLIFSLQYDSILPMNWTSIFAILWLLYTAFCIGVTIRMIVKHIRKKKTEHP